MKDQLFSCPVVISQTVSNRTMSIKRKSSLAMRDYLSQPLDMLLNCLSEIPLIGFKFLSHYVTTVWLDRLLS